MAKYLPDNVRLKTVQDGIRKSHGVWYLPVKEMIRELVEFRPDAVLTNNAAFPSWYTELYSYLRGEHIPLFAWLLGDFWTEYSALFSNMRFPVRMAGPMYLFAWSTGLAFADHILTICGWLEKKVRKRFPSKKTSVFYQGIDPEPWLVEGEVYPFAHPAIGILQDNNILPKVMGLLRFSEVAREMQNVNFYIAGGGPYTALVKDAFSGLRNVRFVGRLSFPEEVCRFYRSCDIYVLASGLDCCPTTLLEASLCGRPVVASNVGGVPELILEGRTGWTVPNGKTDLWIERIATLLEDKDLLRSMGDGARKFALENFSWSVQAPRLVSILTEPSS
jgi:glycosyltransferase involved in cell wall biosynthesis